MHRRTFIKGTTCGTTLALLGGLGPVSQRNLTAREDALFQRFQYTKAQAKPFFRWWWNGNRINHVYYDFFTRY